MSHTLIQDALFTAKSSRELDRLAREQQGIAGTVLMKRAARAALAELLDAFGTPSLLTVFCGSGNNGGDGYVLAALAAEKNITVQCIELGASLGEMLRRLSSLLSRLESASVKRIAISSWIKV